MRIETLNNRIADFCEPSCYRFYCSAGSNILNITCGSFDFKAISLKEIGIRGIYLFIRFESDLAGGAVNDFTVRFNIEYRRESYFSQNHSISLKLSTAHIYFPDISYSSEEESYYKDITCRIDRNQLKRLASSQPGVWQIGEYELPFAAEFAQIFSNVLLLSAAEPVVKLLELPLNDNITPPLVRPARALPLMENKSPLLYRREFTLTEFARIARGFAPRDMDDRWFIFLENDWLYIHRSWTGFCIYEIRFERRGDLFAAVEAWVNSNSEHYQFLGTDSALTDLSWLLEGLFNIEIP